MPTTVGTESNPQDLVRNLLQLEHDAIAAYDSTIERLDNAAYREKVAEFRRDHEAHVQELGRIANTLGVPAPREGDMKQVLTTGKVALADLAGDGAMLKAMKTNEDDTVKAYEQALSNSVTDAAMRPVLEKGLSDERHHRTLDGNRELIRQVSSLLGAGAVFAPAFSWTLSAYRMVY